MSPVAAGSDQAKVAELSAYTLPGLPADGTGGSAGGGSKTGPAIGPGITITPTITATPIPITVTPTITVIQPLAGSSYAQARAYYVSGSTAWSNAWGASDFTLIRQYLTQAKTEFTSALTTANAVNDPANAANLALVKSVSTAYIALADAALAMYDGTDAYSAGQTQMSAANYAAAAASFQTAADRSDASKTLFGQATTTLQSVVYAGTEYGDGSAYTAVIVPILNGKAQYVGDYATYARAWQHTALAFQATAAGNQATFQSEGTQAMNLFAGLRTNPTFGADATTNYNILVGLLGSAGPTPVVSTPTATATPTTTTPTPKITTPTPKITTPTTTPTPSGDWTTHSGWDYTYNPSKLGADSGSQVAWKWDFGDGGTSTQQSGVHVYTREGWWTVKLTVTYSDGDTETFSTTVHTYYRSI